MKKAVAIMLVIYVLSMGTMVLWGFIDKQTKEAGTDNPSENMLVTNSNANNSATPTTQDEQATVQPKITLTDVARHKTPSDCWMVIENSVYNVTNYVDMHPGGADIVLMYCGKDATSAYKTQGGRGRGHSSKADALLVKYKVGDIN